ncbi:ligand-binding sensor domain-containing protein [Pedobacter sp. UYP30]|uniref:sensor histidine kinase n=1 Tax=Pedobacter sp. UYP30 TaxID=1756400 RepID=UPI003393C603
MKTSIQSPLAKFMFHVVMVMVVLSIYLPSAIGQTTYLPHYSTKSGLASNTCYFIHQDKKGFLWIATSNGVSRFDGTNFQNFGIEDGLPDTQILQIAEDRQERLWFFALNGQVSFLKDGKFYNASNNKVLAKIHPGAVVVSFLQDKAGRIWLGTNSNLILCIDGTAVKTYSSANKKYNFFNAFLHQDKKGNIYALSDGCVHRFDGNNFELINVDLSPLSFMNATNTGNNALVFLNSQGLTSYKNGQLSNIISIPNNLLKNSSGYFYYDQPKQRAWLATLSGAIAIDSAMKTVKYLQDIAINQVVKDKAANIWFATNSGLYMLPKESSRLSIIDAEDGLSSNIIKSIAKDNKNRLWLGTDDAVIDILNTSTFKTDEVGLDDFKKFRTIKQLVFDSTTNSIYFSSEFGLGVFKQVDKNTSNVKYLSETNNSLFVIKNFGLNKTNNKLALALSSGVINLEDCQNNLNFNATNLIGDKNFIKGRAYHVYYDKKGSLWFSNVNGLGEFKNGKIIKHYRNNILLTKRINDIYELNDGTLLLATDGYGLLFYKNNKIIKQLKQSDGLTNNICLKIFVKNKEIWVLNSAGVNKISNYPAKPQIANFDYGKDLLTDDVNDLFIDDSTAYFATNRGLILFNYVKNRSNTNGPPVYITSIKKDRERLSLNTGHFNFTSGNNSIFLMFSAIDFSTSDITYRYRLNPNIPFIETKTRRLDFSSLQPGDYNFEVSAKSQNSNWGNSAAISFSIAKQFWQTWWFLACVLLTAGVLFFKLAAYLIKKQKNKEQNDLKLRNRVLMLEQQALQAMMNPHFVFNVMNAIQHYINTQNTASANKVLTGFARLIRKNLEICTKGSISLHEEIEYLKLYLNLEKNRFGDKLTYHFNIDETLDLEETFIPSMLLQPYVENAIWHGIMPKEAGGRIEIHILLKAGDILEIEIIDDGVGIDNSLRTKKGTHLSKGMQLTAERLKLLAEIGSKNIQLKIKQNTLNGTTVSISMPI